MEHSNHAQSCVLIMHYSLIVSRSECRTLNPTKIFIIYSLRFLSKNLKQEDEIDSSMIWGSLSNCDCYAIENLDLSSVWHKANVTIKNAQMIRQR